MEYYTLYSYDYWSLERHAGMKSGGLEYLAAIVSGVMMSFIYGSKILFKNFDQSFYCFI
jgi:hypothetical protein